MGLLVTRFEYPHANDEIIARQRRIPGRRLVGESPRAFRWPDVKAIAHRSLQTFATRAGRKKAKLAR